MSGSRSQNLRGSLGDSWGDADYSSDGGASIHSACSLSDAESESEYDIQERKDYAREDQDIATPLPPRVTRTNSHTAQHTPTTTPTRRIASRHSLSPRSAPRSFQCTPESLEPSFIMPSMHTSTNSFQTGSPQRTSEFRTRRSRPPFAHTQPPIMTKNKPRSVPSLPQAPSRNQPPQYKQEQDNPQLWHYVDLFCKNVLQPILRYVLDVLRHSLENLKPVFGAGLALVFLIIFIQYSTGYLQRSVQLALTPMCYVPGSTYIFPFCNAPDTSPKPTPPDFERLVKIQNSFEEVVLSSKDSGNLPKEMTSSRQVVIDLRSLVKYSNLPSRSELEVEFTSFIESAKEASMQLSKYNVNIGRALSKVIHTNEWTLRDLEGIADKQIAAGSWSRVLYNFNPFAVFVARPNDIHQALFDRYIFHLSDIKEEIKDLIEAARALITLLNALESQLDVIGDISTRDNVIVNKNRDELLSQLWTMLGGNRRSKKSFNEQLALLTKVQRYRKLALDHVTTTLLRLQEIETGLENLREEVAVPELVGYESQTPLRFHIELIEKSLDGFRDLQGRRMSEELEGVRSAMKRLPEETVERGLPGSGQIPTVYARVGGE